MNPKKRKFAHLLKFSLLLFLLAGLFLRPLNFFSWAKEATKAAPKRVKDAKLEKIKKLKEKVATKVAELRKKGKRAYFGQISKIGPSSLILITKKGEVRILVDEETKIFKVSLGKRKKIALKNLKEGEKIVAIGISPPEELPAKVIIAKRLPFLIHGRVNKVDLEGGTIAVKTRENLPAGRQGSEFIVDYEVTTKCRMFEKSLPAGRQGKGLIRCGLSKIKVGDRVHVVGTIGKEETRLTAHRILVLPGKAFGVTGEKPATPTATLAPSPIETE